jgi:chemotaxis protein MotB
MAKPTAKAEADPWAALAPAPQPAAPVARWILSFVDLTGILVAFFVLLFSMKNPDAERWQALQSSMYKAFSPHPTVVGENMPAGRLNAPARPYRKSDGLIYLQQLLQRRLADDALWSRAQTQVEGGEALRLALPPALVAGTALTPLGQAAFARLAAVLRNWDNAMNVTLRGGTAAQRAAALGGAAAAATALRDGGVTSLEGVQLQPGAGDVPLSLALEVRATP